MRKALGVERWIDGLDRPRSALAVPVHDDAQHRRDVERVHGPGMKTILPHVATREARLAAGARSDARRAARADPQAPDAKGFSDVKVRKLSGYPPAQTSVESPLVRAAIGVFNKYGITPSVAPRLAGSAPYYVFTDRLKLPMVMGGIGHGTGAHAPDEYMVIEPRAGSRWRAWRRSRSSTWTSCMRSRG